MSDNYILEINTDHAQPFKTLFEVLKEPLQDINIEIKRDETKMNEEDGEEVDNSDESDLSDDESDSEYEDSDDEESDDKELANKKLANKESDNEESDNEESDNEESDNEESDNEESDNKSDEKKEEDKKKRGYMRVMAVDPTKTIFIHLKLDASNFRKFKVKRDKIVIGVNLACFHKLIKSMDKDDNLTLFIKKNDEQNLGIKRYNPEKKKTTIDLMQLIDLNKEKYKIPPTVFESVIKMPSNDFHKVCREMSNIADYVEISCINNKLIFKCKGEYAQRSVTYVDDYDEYDEGASDKIRKSVVRIKHADSDSNKLKIVREVYELKNITLFNKFTSLCDDLQMFMKNKYPLVIRYTVATLGQILVCFTPVKLEENRSFEDEQKMY